MRRLWVVLSLAVGLSLPAVVSHADTKPANIKAKIAYVDFERCVRESEDGLRAQANLNRFQRKGQMEISAMRDALESREHDIEDIAKKKGEGAPELMGLQLEFSKRQQELVERDREMQVAIMTKEEALRTPIEKRVREACDKIAKAEGFDLIVDRKALSLGTHSEVDLTERVLHDVNWAAITAASAAASASALASAVPSASASK
jgi:outer membrane protein